MLMPAFTNTLNYNEIMTSIANMIISQQVFDRIGDSSELVDEAKADGTLYGDTKLFYACDALKTHAWGNDAEAANLLALHRPADPKVQAITLDVFRQIDLTIDDILSKRAFSTEYAFEEFNAILESMLGSTKRIYDVTTYNAFVGTDEVVAQTEAITVATNESPEGRAKKISKGLADLIVQITKVNRKYNEYGHITKFAKNDIIVVWNSAFVNEIKKVDLPSIFHKDELFDDFKHVLPAEYFGDINASATVGNGSTVRALVEQEITDNGTTYHYFPGELIGSGLTSLAGKSYTTTDDVICKIYVKLPPYMSGFAVSTEFYNPKSLTKNRYLTFGHNTLEHFKAYPCVTVNLAPSGKVPAIEIVDVTPTPGS